MLPRNEASARSRHETARKSLYDSLGRDSVHPFPARLQTADARHLPIRQGSVDLVVSSPPYLNAIDYIRCSKFSLVWMGHRIPQLRHLRSKSIGTESVGESEAKSEAARILISKLKLRPALGQHDRGVLERYVADMLRAVSEVERVLVPGGKAVYVVGENTVRGTYIQNSRIMAEIGALCGLKLKERWIRELPANRRYLPPPCSEKAGSLRNRLRREVVLGFVKPRRRLTDPSCRSKGGNH